MGTFAEDSLSSVLTRHDLVGGGQGGARHEVEAKAFSIDRVVTTSPFEKLPGRRLSSMATRSQSRDFLLENDFDFEQRFAVEFLFAHDLHRAG